MRSGRLAALAAVAALLAGCATTADLPAALRPKATSPTILTGDASILDGHGELAMIWSKTPDSPQRLALLGGPANSLRHVSLPGPASQPMWSPNHRWVAVEVATKRQSGQSAGQLWLVSSAGRAVRPLTPGGVTVLRAAWAPTANRLAVVTHRRGKHVDQLRLVWPSGSSRIVTSAPTIGAISWAPTGGRLALSTDVFGHHEWHSRLEVLRPAAVNVRRRVVTAITGNVLDLAAWWPDGSRLLAWFDPMGSGSLAADGLPLDVIAMSGHRHRIAKRMLTYGSWLALSRAKNEIAIIEGGDRVLTAGHKAVAICSLRDCHRVGQPSRQISMDPTWSAAGKLAVVRDHAVRPNVSGPPFDATYVANVQDSGDITIVTRSTARRLTVAGHGATAPQWGRDGSLLVIRHETVWLVRKRAREVAGPLTMDRRPTFYGHVPWLRAVAWTEALPGAVADTS